MTNFQEKIKTSRRPQFPAGKSDLLGSVSQRRRIFGLCPLSGSRDVIRSEIVSKGRVNTGLKSYLLSEEDMREDHHQQSGGHIPEKDHGKRVFQTNVEDGSQCGSRIGSGRRERKSDEAKEPEQTESFEFL